MLCHLGHVASARRLRQSGVSRRAAARWVASGDVLRPARGTYACSHLDGDALAALRVGCAIDCVSALARNGVWVASSELHVRARAGQHVPPTSARVHWARCHVPPGLEVSATDALLQVMRCLDAYSALASVESALHTGYLRDLDRLVALAPRRMLPVLRRIRRAESGYETLARLRLEDAGHRVRTQVPVGRWRLDLLVDGRVGVEVDGRAWHAHRFIEDRTKDIGTESAGVRVLRIAPTHIVDSWPETLAAVQRMVFDG